MGQNIYVILGVSRDADLPRIRRAYQQMVQRYLPEEAKEPPGAATGYPATGTDRGRARGESPGELPVRVPEPLPEGSGHPPVTAPPRRSRPGAERPLFAAADEFFGGWVPGVYTSGRMASRRKDLYVEIILDPAEAARGGLFPLQVPVERACPECAGTGYHGNVVCPICHGGDLEHHEVRISVPPGVAHGKRAKLSLEDIGLPGVDLNVLVSVAG